MKDERMLAVGTITAQIEEKTLELRKAQEAANRVMTLRMEIGALERARAILEGKDLHDFDRERGSVFVGSGVSRLLVSPPSPRTMAPMPPPMPRDLYKREESIPDMVAKVLREAGKPMTSDEIMAALLSRDRSLSRPSVLGAVYRSAKAGRTFRLVSPGVFGLLEWELEM